MDRDKVRGVFESGLRHFVTVPPELLSDVDGGGDAPQTHEVARRMVLSLLASDEHDALATRLFASIKRAADAGSFASEAVDIASQTFALLSALLQQPRLLDAFDSRNALVTLYFFIVSMMLCANVGISAVQSHEKIIVSVAILMNRLLLNKQVYETSRTAVHGLAKCCAASWAWLGRRRCC